MAELSTRQSIIEAADQLFYQRGYEHTSFADIANTVQISRGNFYYHFKAKDQILEAVINQRLVNTQKMLDKWQIEGKTPHERIRSFINILLANRKPITKYGCPVGSLCMELAKLNHANQSEANELFTLFRTWLHRQFVELGHENQADELAMHLLARSQGVAALASTFADQNFIDKEVQQMHDWLDAYVQKPANKTSN